MKETKGQRKKQKRCIGTRVVFDYFLSNTAIFEYLGIPIEQFAANKTLKDTHQQLIYINIRLSKGPNPPKNPTDATQPNILIQYSKQYMLLQKYL